MAYPPLNPQAGRQVAHVLGHLPERPRLARCRPVRATARPLIDQHQAVAAPIGQRVEIVAEPGVVEPRSAVEDQQQERRQFSALLHIELGVRNLDQPAHRRTLHPG